MAFCFFPVLSALSVSLTFGVDFETCKGSSCRAWLAFVDDSTKEVTIQKHSKEEGSPQYYRIEIKWGGTTFTKHRRYREFNTLKKKLGDVATQLSPFPQKFYFNRIVEKFVPNVVEERRKQLEVWLRKVLDHGDSKGPWARDLFLFLDPVTSVTVAKSGLSMPPDANKICKDNVLFFGIDVATNAGRVWRRYNDFHALHAAIVKLGGMDEDFGVPFPPKIFWKTEAALEERRRGLEAWLGQVKTHSNADSGGIWEKEVKRFLDPAGNQSTLSWGCHLGDAAYEQMGKMYTQIKDKVGNYVGEL